uniref:myotubularin-related protein 9-like isoform X4 n=1 Tax=Macaca mulatta TaxID=9544 RepID=UPI00075FF10C|nr:myotubularin-related protein 9-like isoform X4 [Macaca mulatta]
MERHRQHPACDFTGPTHPGPLEQNHDWIPGTGGVGVDPGKCPCEVRARTHSLWSWLSQPKEQQRLRNPLYILNPLAICGAPEPAAGQGEPHTFSTGDYPSAQRPDLCSSSSGLFLRWTHSPEPAEAAWGKSVANSDRKGEDRSLSANYFSPHPKHWLLGQQPRHS